MDGKWATNIIESRGQLNRKRPTEMVHCNTENYNQNYNYNKENLRLHADVTVY